MKQFFIGCFYGLLIVLAGLNFGLFLVHYPYLGITILLIFIILGMGLLRYKLYK
jgi:hypothetical protein